MTEKDLYRDNANTIFLADADLRAVEYVTMAEHKRVCAEHDRLREAATRLCGAASRVALAAPSSGPLWHGSREMKELQEALLSGGLKKLMAALQEDGDES